MRSWLVLPVVAVGLVLVAGCEACREKTPEPPSDRRATFHIYVPYSSNISYPSVDEMKAWGTEKKNKIGPGGVLLYPTEGSWGTRLRKLYYKDTPGGRDSLPIPASSFRYVEMTASTEASPQYGTVTVYEQLPVSASRKDTSDDLMLTKVFYYEARMHAKEGESLKFRGTSGSFQPGYNGDYKTLDGTTRVWPEGEADSYYVELFVDPEYPRGFVGKTYFAIFHKGSGPPASDFWKAAIPSTPPS